VIKKNAACAKSPVAIPPAIIEPGFVAVAQAQAGAVRPGEFEFSRGYRAPQSIPERQPAFQT